MLVALGGVAIVLHISVIFITLLFLAMGLVLAGMNFRHLFPFRRPPRWAWALFGVVAGGAFLLVAMEQAAVGLHIIYLNPCDDLLSYLPMTHRLLETRALIEPWSIKRLQIYGGQTMLQALPVRFFGDNGLGLVETVLASVFLGGLVLASPVRTVWARLVCLSFVCAIPLFAIPRVNASPVLMMVPLVAGGLAAIAELRLALRERDTSRVVRWAIASGLVIAAVTAIRAYLAPALGLCLLLGALTASGVKVTSRARVQAIGIAVISGAAVMVAWCVALWQSSGALIYPITSGNLNPAVPASSDPALKGFGAVAGRALHLATVGPYLWAALVILGASLVFRRFLSDPAFVAIAAAATITNVFALAFTLTEHSRYNFGRLTSPLSAGLVVFMLIEVLRGTERAINRRQDFAANGVPILMVGATVALVAWVFYVTNPGILSLTVQSAHDAISTAIHGRAEQQITPPNEPGDYDRALAATDPGRTIAAVDRPYLIDYAKYNVPSLDQPGWAAPNGEFPFFSGPLAKVQTLRRAGFRQLLVTVPNDNVCLSPSSIQLRLAVTGDSSARLYSRYFLDFENDIETIIIRAPNAVQRFGTLLVLDLPRAEQALKQ